MKKLSTIFVLAISLVSSYAFACENCKKNDNNPDFKVKSATARVNKKFSQLEFEIVVEGSAGKTLPKPAGKLDGAPVLGYVIATTLKPEDIGFSKTDGIVALALTSHPDFDDTPIWDEDMDGNYTNASEGIVWHPHWVVLVKDDRVKGGLSVKEFDKNDKSVKLPATAPGMPMYMDSPGFQITTEGNTMRVAIPTYRIKNNVTFNYDIVACYMEISAPEGGHKSGMKMPMLGVYTVYSILSKNLSLPYTIKQ